MWRFLGVDGDKAKDAIGWSLRWQSAWPVWVVALAAVVAIVYVWRIYRREASPLGPGDRLVLTGLRLVAVGVLLVMIFEPIIRWDVPAERDASLVVLLDDSQSMNVSDRYEGTSRLRDVARLLWPEATKGWSGLRVGDLPPAQREAMTSLTRAGLVNRLLGSDRTNVLVPVSEMFNVHVCFFSEELKQAASGFRKAGETKTEGVAADLMKVRVVPEGKVTRAGDLLRQAVAARRGSVAGVLLVTDGVSNVGEDLDSTARFLKERRIPVYAVGVGDPRPLRDVSVANVTANRIVLLNDLVAVDFDLESRGFAGEPVTVRLFRAESSATDAGAGEPVPVVQEGRVLPAAEFRLEEPKAEKDGIEIPLPQKCRLGFRADLKGDFTYRLVVECRPEELLAQNNAASIAVRVIESKIKVLYVEGLPRWDYRFLKNALIRDETIDVSCFLSSADFDFPQAADLPLALLPTKEEEIAPYDVVILGDVPRKVFSDAQLDLFYRFVDKLGGGLLMEAGPYFAPREYRGTPVEKLLPADLTGGAPASAEGTQVAWHPTLTADGETHAMTRFDADATLNRRVWERLPGLFWHYPVDRAKPGAQVLLAHPTDRSTWGPRPLLMTQFFGSGKTAFLAVDSTWLWRGRVGDRWFMRFWGQVIRDLSQGRFIGTTKRFRVATDRSEYRAGERVTITARVLDKDYEPSRFGEIRARVEGEGGVVFVRLEAVAGEAGSFRGSVTPAVPGSYRTTLDVAEPALDETAVSHVFLVVPSRLEFIDPHMRRDELKRLADATGGRYFDVSQVAEIPSVIERLKAATVRETDDELWNAPALFTAFCAAFFGELIYRKLRKLL